METASFGQGRRVEAPDPVSACGAWGVPLGTARTASRLSARGTTPACVSPADRTETLDAAQEPALVDPKSKLQQAAEEGPPQSASALPAPPPVSSSTSELGYSSRKPGTAPHVPPIQPWPGGQRGSRRGGPPPRVCLLLFTPTERLRPAASTARPRDSFICWKRKRNCQPKTLHPLETFPRSEDEMKTFSDERWEGGSPADELVYLIPTPPINPRKLNQQ